MTKLERDRAWRAANPEKCRAYLKAYRERIKARAPKEGIFACSRCHEAKPASDYYKQKSNARGLSYFCKLCAHKRVMSWCRLNPLKVKVGEWRRFDRLSKEAKDAVTGKAKARAALQRSRLDDSYIRAKLGIDHHALIAVKRESLKVTRKLRELSK